MKTPRAFIRNAVRKHQGITPDDIRRRACGVFPSDVVVRVVGKMDLNKEIEKKDGGYFPAKRQQ